MITTERVRCACPCKRSFIRNVGGNGRPRVYFDPRRCKFKAFRKRAKNRGAVSVEWYSPPEIFEEARILARVERFDLDPATCPKSPIWPLVARHFTQDDDGLAQAWDGATFCNPPYGRVIAVWIAKAIAERYRDPNRAIVLLVPVKADTKWWHDAKAAGFEAMTRRGRIRFLEPDPETDGLRRMGSGKFASAFLVWFGSVDSATKPGIQPTSPEDALTSIGAR